MVADGTHGLPYKRIVRIFLAASPSFALVVLFLEEFTRFGNHAGFPLLAAVYFISFFWIIFSVRCGVVPVFTLPDRRWIVLLAVFGLLWFSVPVLIPFYETEVLFGMNPAGSLVWAVTAAVLLFFAVKKISGTGADLLRSVADRMHNGRRAVLSVLSGPVAGRMHNGMRAALTAILRRPFRTDRRSD